MNKPVKSRHNNYSKKPDFDVTTVCPGLKVSVQGTDERSFMKALRTFNKKVQDSGLLREIRDRTYYEKASIVRKRKKAIAVKREQKRLEDSSIHRKRLF